jgi:RNA polymerase sigma-70 factor (ECF subfamily)
MVSSARLPGSSETASEGVSATEPESVGGTAAGKVLAAIYHSEQAKLIRYLQRRVGTELAPDLAQEVFARVAASPQLLQLVNPGGYLCRIAQNLLIDRQRRQRCRTDPLPLIEAIDAPCAPDQEDNLMAEDLQRELDIVLQELPDRTRRVFMMHRFEDMAYRDIHRELGISLAAVGYHMARAQARVRGAVDAVG